MALGARHLPLLRDVLEELGRGAEVLAIGYPDLLPTPEQLAAVWPLSDGPLRTLPADRAARILRRHGVKSVRPVVCSHHLFQRLGHRLTVLDARSGPGVDLLMDLNQPLRRDVFREAYDLILDLGSTEHVFCPGTALLNYHGLLRPGGFIVHENPCWMPNHGYWHPQPRLWIDFYTLNKYERLPIETVPRGPGPAQRAETGRHRPFPGREELTRCVARKPPGKTEPARIPYDLERR